MPPVSRSVRLVRRAAGFRATSVWTLSPGVWMSVLAKWTWKPETPASVPAGARISAGKSGSVLMSLPRMAETLVNWVPASCMPSPESPQNGIVTESRSWTHARPGDGPGASGVADPAEGFAALMKTSYGRGMPLGADFGAAGRGGRGGPVGVREGRRGYIIRPAVPRQAPSRSWGTASGSGG